MSSESPLRIFLSHHSSKAPTAVHLAAYLERHGIQTWYAPRDIPGGHNWDEAIASAIQRSSALVLLFCANADASTHVKREINLADRAKIPIYWLRLESVEPDKLGYFLNSTQWIDWLDQRDNALDVLVRDLRSGADIVGNPPTAAEEHPQSPVGGTPAWPHGVFIFESDRHAAEAAARVYMRSAEEEPDQCLILPTGRAATHIFRAITRIATRLDQPPFRDAHLITDTETFGVYERHPTSRTRHVREMLIDPLQEMGMAPPPSQLHLLSGLITEIDPLENARRVIRRWPPGVHAVSVAPSGEVLAYEVGTYTDGDALAATGVQVIELNEHGRGYIDPDQPSRSVLSVGIGTALASATLLVLAFAGNKGGILRRMITGTETAGVPATILRRHNHAHVLTTRTVAEEAGITDIGSVVTPDEAVERIQVSR